MAAGLGEGESTEAVPLKENPVGDRSALPRGGGGRLRYLLPRRARDHGVVLLLLQGRGTLPTALNLLQRSRVVTFFAG